MAGKKRSSTSMDSPNRDPPPSDSSDSSDSSDNHHSGDDTSAAAKERHQNLKPMERRKKRKALDKERHAAEPKRDEISKNKQPEGPSTEEPPTPSGLPELHMGLFRDLSSVESSVREAAVEVLARELSAVQSVYKRSGGEGNVGSGAVKMEAEKDDGLDNCAGSVRYAVRRLIRGVSSSRECARQGFALALTVVLATVPDIKVESVMKLIVNMLEISSSMKGQEAKDSFLGRLFAYGALVRSGRMSDEWLSGGNTSCLGEFIDQVLFLAGKKQYLQEPSASVIFELAKKLSPEVLSVHVLGAQSIHQWFQKAITDKNPDALFLALKLQEMVCLDGDAFGGLLPSKFNSNNFFSVEHLSLLIPCLQESTFCLPRVHSVWSVLVNLLLSDVAFQEEDAAIHSSKKRKKNRKGNSEDAVKNVKNFVEIVIEGSLLASSHDRKDLALKVLLLLLPRLPASCIHLIVSYKLVRCLMDVLPTKGSWLYGAAQHFVKEMVNWIGDDVDRLVGATFSLQKHSNGRFDCITQTHTVKNLVSRFDSCSGCIKFVHSLINLFVEGGHLDELSDQSQTTDENSEKGSREDSPSVPGSDDFLNGWIIDILPRVLKNLRDCPKIKSRTPDSETAVSKAANSDFVNFSEEKFRVQAEIMKFLAVQGLFSASLGTEITSFELQEKFRWPKLATSTSLRKRCIEQLETLMEDAQREDIQRGFLRKRDSLRDELHMVSYEPETNDLGSYFICFLTTLCNIPSVTLFRTLSNEDEKSFKNLLEMETRLFQEEGKIGPGPDANKLHALRYLLIQLLLQVLLHPGEFSEAATDLVKCCKNAFPEHLESHLGEDDDESKREDDAAPDMIDVLLDTLLSLLHQSSGSMYYAIEQVFRFFCTEIADSGLLSMLRIVKKDLKPLRHQVESDDEGEEDEDLLQVEDTEDVGEIETIDTADSDVEEAVDEPDEKIESNLIEGDDDDEYDDDAMFKMDSYITSFLKNSGKSGNDSVSSKFMAVKFRVLSLLEIYLHRNPGKPQVFTIYSHLARAFVNYSSAEGFKQLSERIGGILQKKIFKAKEYPKGSEIEVSMLETLLEKSLKSASRARIKSVSSLAQNSVLWIFKIIQSRNLSESELEGVRDILQKIVADYFDSKKCRLKADFLKEVLKRYPWAGCQLFTFLLDKCSSTKSEFRRVEALDLIDAIMKSCASPVKGDSDKEKTRKSKFLKSHLPQLCSLIQQLLIKLPEKQSRRAGIRKFCARTFEAISSLKLNKHFLKSLEADAQSACEAQLGDLFRALRNPQKVD